jgi:hypothetical protein
MRVMLNSGVVITYARVPVAETLLLGSNSFVQMADLTNYTQCRLQVNRQVGTIAGARMILRCGTQFSALPGGYVSMAAAPAADVTLDVGAGGAFAVSQWFDLATAARGNVLLAPLMVSGDGRTDLLFGNIVAEFR